MAAPGRIPMSAPKALTADVIADSYVAEVPFPDVDLSLNASIFCSPGGTKHQYGYHSYGGRSQERSRISLAGFFLN